VRHTRTVNAGVLAEKFSWYENSSSVLEFLAGPLLARVAIRPLSRIPS
jgi:hypothetical protein